MVTLFLFLLAIFSFLFYVILNVMEGRKVAIYAHPLYLLVSECKVRAFYGFSGDKEGRGPAIESLGTEASLLIHNK